MANLNKRAALVAMAEKLTTQQLPWIPDVEPTTVLLLGKGLTGAVSSFACMFSPGPTSWEGPAERAAGECAFVCHELTCRACCRD